MKLRVGDDGPEGTTIEAALEAGTGRVIELDLGPMEAAREEDSDDMAGARGCCLILRKPAQKNED